MYRPKLENIFGPFCSPLWILCVEYKNVVWWVGFLVGFWEKEKLYYRSLYFSLIIVKFLQLRKRRQIVKPHKYCLVRMIIFSLACIFSSFLFLTDWEFRINSLQSTRLLPQNLAFLRNKNAATVEQFRLLFTSWKLTWIFSWFNKF